MRNLRRRAGFAAVAALAALVAAGCGGGGSAGTLYFLLAQRAITDAFVRSGLQ